MRGLRSCACVCIDRGRCLAVEGGNFTEHSYSISTRQLLLLSRIPFQCSSILELTADDLQLVRGEGQYVFDKNGRKYLDCVNNVTHGKLLVHVCGVLQ